MKQPNFFIIGAPKCGTTSMSAWLGEHPQIFMSDPKEPQFFNTDINNPKGTKTLDKYLQIFQNAGDIHLAVGEASVWYLLSHVAVKNIIEFNPDARFIVMLRNPIEMASSCHGQQLLHNSYNRNWYNRQILDDFEEDWKAQYACKSKPAGYNALLHEDTVLLQYDKVCKLGEQVQRLLQTVDAKSVLFIVMDDLISDPLHEYRRVLKFLDVPYDGKSQFSRHNPASRPVSKLIRRLIWRLSFSHVHIKQLLGIKRGFGLLTKINKFNTKPHKAQPIRPEFKQELIEVFREDVKLLSSLLGRNFEHWLR